MQITRDSVDTNPGPSDWFTGAVYIDPIATPSSPSRLSAARVVELVFHVSLSKAAEPF